VGKVIFPPHPTSLSLGHLFARRETAPFLSASQTFFPAKRGKSTSRGRLLCAYANSGVNITFTPLCIFYHSIGFIPCFSSRALALEKWRHPKKPRCADKGLGCTVANL